MKIFSLLLLFPGFCFAFQNEIAASITSSEISSSDKISSFTTSIDFYSDDVYYDGKPYRQASFLSKTSSFSIGLSSATSDSTSNTSDEKTTGYSISRNHYIDDDYLFSGGISSATTTSENEEIEIRNYFATAGLFSSKSTLYYLTAGIIDYISADATVTSTGLGVKNYYRRHSFIIESSNISFDEDNETFSGRLNLISYEYYPNHQTYIGINYSSLTSAEVFFDDIKTSELFFGSLINRTLKFSTGISRAEDDSGVKIDTYSINFGYTF